MRKLIFIFLIFLSQIQGNQVQDSLPEPYKSTELLPFNPQGWYENHRQIESLVKLFHVKNVIEVGSWLGLSTRHIASLLPEGGKVYAIDHWKGSEEHQSSSILPSLYQQFLSNVIHENLAHKIVPIRMASLDAAQCFRSLQVPINPDLIYIDASHDTDSVYADLIAWYPFVKDHGVLCGDDWNWNSVRVAVEKFAHERNLHIQASGNFWSLLKSEAHQNLPTVTFATAVYEKDWRQILLDPDFLRIKKIENHCFPFAERLLIINNVEDVELVKGIATRLIEEGILTRFIVTSEISNQVFSFFRLNASDFSSSRYAHIWPEVTDEWLFYNALAPLAAIYACQSDYLLYCTGDVWLDRKADWINSAIELMENNSQYKVANLTWNNAYEEAKNESHGSIENDFYVSNAGFSDQLFLVKTDDFRQPIYNEIRGDAMHFPRGDTFEKRVFSHMKNCEWRRLIFRFGSYIHDFPQKATTLTKTD